jgi:hypothetical protein
MDLIPITKTPPDGETMLNAYPVYSNNEPVDTIPPEAIIPVSDNHSSEDEADDYSLPMAAPAIVEHPIVCVSLSTVDEANKVFRIGGVEKMDFGFDEDSMEPAYVGVTLCNANHKHRFQSQDASVSSSSTTRRLFRRQHSIPSMKDVIGLQLDVTASGDLQVIQLDKSSSSFPWSNSLVSVGDTLVSINHESVHGCTIPKVSWRLYKAVTGSLASTTLLFSKPDGDARKASVTVEKFTPQDKLGFRMASKHRESPYTSQSLRVSSIFNESALVPSCLVHEGDSILSINGRSASTIASEDSRRSLAKIASSEISSSPRYVNLVTTKSRRTAVVLSTGTKMFQVY